MRRVKARSLSVLLAITSAGFGFGLGGCESCDKKPAASADASPTASVGAMTATSEAPSASPSASASARAKHDMGNCPTAVASADVVVRDVEGGVEVAVTAKDEAATKDIRERMKKIAEADKNDGASGQRHDHSGSGGGRTGRCTIIMRGTTLTTAEIPNGAKATVLAKDTSELDWLRRETKERDKEAKSALAAGAGAKRMANCPSAVEGAKTTVTDLADGALVTVTGPADKVAEIRERAKHAAAVAKRDGGTKGEHGGDGSGGGGLGRCPIVVDGDTRVAIKEIDGGAEVAVTTKGADAIAALQKEAKARAVAFRAK